VNDWPLMDSPLPTMTIVAVYLYLVVDLGPRLMANKKPYQLNAVLVVYNAVQVIFSVFMLWEVRNTNASVRQLI
jgi:elongation of very long chain fatty acids protein 7